MNEEILKCFQVLEIEPTSSHEVIKQAYRELTKVWHPDRFQDPKLQARGNEKLKQLNHAYHSICAFKEKQTRTQAQANRSEGQHTPSNNTSQEDSKARASSDHTGGSNTEDPDKFLDLGKAAEHYLDSKLKETRFLIPAILSALSMPEAVALGFLRDTFKDRGQIIESSDSPNYYPDHRVWILPGKCGLQPRIVFGSERTYFGFPIPRKENFAFLVFGGRSGWFTWEFSEIKRRPKFEVIELSPLGRVLYETIRAEQLGKSASNTDPTWRISRKELGRILDTHLKSIVSETARFRSLIDELVGKNETEANTVLGKIGEVSKVPDKGHISGEASLQAGTKSFALKHLKAVLLLDASGCAYAGLVAYSEGESEITFQTRLDESRTAVRNSTGKILWKISKYTETSPIDQLVKERLAPVFWA